MRSHTELALPQNRAAEEIQVPPQFPEFTILILALNDLANIQTGKGTALTTLEKMRLFAGAAWADYPDRVGDIAQICNITPKQVYKLIETAETSPSWDAYQETIRRRQQEAEKDTAISPQEKKDLLDSARKKLLDILSERPAILQDEEEIRAVLQAAHIPGTTGRRRGDHADHVRKLSIVRRLRAQGHKMSDIPRLSNIKSKGVAGNLVTELRVYGLTEKLPSAPFVREQTKAIAAIFQRERAANPHITHAQVAQIASAELGLEIKTEQVTNVMELHGKNILKKRTPIEEHFALFELYIQEHETTHPGGEINVREAAKALNMNPEYCRQVYQRYKKSKEANPQS